MSTIVQDIGKMLRTYRLREGITQEELAERADLHFTYIGQVERGEKNLTLASLEKILNALGVSFAEFFENMKSGKEKKSIASLCYEMVNGKSEEEQMRLYHILCEIEALMDK